MSAEKIQPEITADWAREQTQNVISDKSKIQLNEILINIKKAVSENRKYTHVNSIDEIVKKELTKRGFYIEFVNITSIDPREHSYYVISW